MRICKRCSTSVEKFGREVADFGPSTRPAKAGLALRRIRQAHRRQAQDLAQDLRCTARALGDSRRVEHSRSKTVEG